MVRGPACADVSVGGRARRVDARGAEPWYVAELAGVEAFALGPLQRSPGDLRQTPHDLPIDGGVVFGPWLGWSARPPAQPPRSVPTPVQQPLPAFDPQDTNVLGDLGRRAASLRRTAERAARDRADARDRGRRRVPARRPARRSASTRPSTWAGSRAARG